MMVAKGLSGGYASLAGVIAHERVIDVLRAGGGRYEHNFTFAGNPVACAVGSAVLDAYTAEGIADHVAEVEPVFFAGLNELRRHPIVGDVRGQGTAGRHRARPAGRSRARSRRRPAPSAGSTSPRRSRACSSTRARGSSTASSGDAAMLLPPLTITASEIGQLVERLDAALESTTRTLLA